MKQGIHSQPKYIIDDEEFIKIELAINKLIQECPPHYEKILEIIYDIGILRIQSATHKSPLWLIARHSDKHPELLKIILKKFGQNLSSDDFNVSPNEGAFKDKTAKWLAQFAPVACDDEFKLTLTKTINQFDKSFAFELHYSNIYLPYQQTSRTGRLDKNQFHDSFSPCSKPKYRL